MSSPQKLFLLTVCIIKKRNREKGLHQRLLTVDVTGPELIQTDESGRRHRTACRGGAGTRGRRLPPQDRAIGGAGVMATAVRSWPL